MWHRVDNVHVPSDIEIYYSTYTSYTYVNEGRKDNVISEWTLFCANRRRRVADGAEGTTRGLNRSRELVAGWPPCVRTRVRGKKRHGSNVRVRA